MNILYYTTEKLDATKGGTERTTITVASALTKNYNCRCFSVYEREAQTQKDNSIIKEYHWVQKRNDLENIEFLRNIIRENKIQCVIVQGAFVHVRRFRKAVSGIGCKVIFAHHFRPYWEISFFRFNDIIRNRPTTLYGSARWLKNIILYPWMRIKYVKALASSYGDAYENADRTVLLSSSFIKDFQKFGNFEENSKFTIIPNGLSFKEFATEGSFSNKKKIVLIVARQQESSKKISLALRIWNAVKLHSEAEEWKLLIIGDGPDKQYYTEMVDEENIPDVYFLGRQDPVPYYRMASIFMMTSKSESWGLTLTEAQQMGVVPVAFNTYESLVDIITDNENGRIITKNDFSGYVSAILDLMVNDEMRLRLAKGGLESCKRFRTETIAALWWNLINEPI